MKQLLKKYFLIIGLVAIIVPIWVLAGPNDNVSGYAWSDMPDGSDEIKTPGNHYGGRGLGWIKLNGDLYGVNLNESTGAFDGYAWSEYGGWVDFSPSGPYPAGPNHGAQVDPGCLADRARDDCYVTGWIRFTAGGSEQSGGWDGWVKMSGNWNEGVKLGAADANGVRPMSGKAWGDMVAGWIDFKWAEVKTTVDPPRPIEEECLDPDATNYLSPEDRDPNKTYVNDSELCEYDPPILGCTDPDASNYNPDANEDDGSCDVCVNITGIQNTVPQNMQIVPRWQCVSTADVCPTTNYDLWFGGDPREGIPDPRTVGNQTVLPVVGGVSYEVRGGQCALFGCTRDTNLYYNPNATVHDPALCFEQVHIDACDNIPGSQPRVPLNHYQVIKNGFKYCYPNPIVGCMTPGYDNYDSNADTPGTCTCIAPKIWNGTACVTGGGGSGDPKQPIIIEG